MAVPYIGNKSIYIALKSNVLPQNMSEILSVKI